MAGLYVMISHHYGIVAHPVRHTGIKMRGKRIDIVVVIRCVVPLYAVADIYQETIP